MNRDIINYFKHQYEDEPSLKNKHNYANELSNSHSKKDIIKAIELLKEIQECSDFDLKEKLLQALQPFLSVVKDVHLLVSYRLLLSARPPQNHY